MKYFECIFETNADYERALDLLRQVEEKKPQPKPPPPRPVLVALGGHVDDFKQALNSAGIQHTPVYDQDFPASTFGLSET